MANRGFFVTPEHTCYYQDCKIPQPGENEVVIKTAAVGICGSDIHYYLEGKVGDFALTSPYVPGHEASGTITAIGNNVSRWEVGQRVVIEPGIPCRFCKACIEGRYNLCENQEFMSGSTCDGCLRQYFSIREDMVYALPESMSFEQGALVEPTAVAVHVLKRAGSVVGKRVAIFGLGPIGMLVGMVAKAFGCGEVVCLDINQDRLEKAKRICADRVVNTMYEKLLDAFADIVFETAGSPITVAQSFYVAAPGARIVQVGWTKSGFAEISTSLMLSKELDYVASYLYGPGDFDAAIGLISTGRIKAEQIVTHRFQFQETDKAFDFTVKNPGDVLKPIVVF